MTYGESDRPEPGGNDARAAAKERARELRTLHRKQERRRRLVLQLGILGGALVVIAIVAVTLISMNQAPARGPLQTRDQALAQLREVAEFFRRTEPHSPVAYLADKAASWGEMSLHLWLRTVLKNDETLSGLEELLGVQKPSDSNG